MKKSLAACYLVIGMAICLVPFAGMSAFRTDTTTENKTLASFPQLVDEGELNLEFFDELGEYFEDHFAFREALVNADALIQSKVFGVSNVSTIITGENGWLYYSATLDDYLGQDLMSDRAIFNAAHNLALTQEYVEAKGAQFSVTVAPNKNSLYGDNMPYYDSYIVSEEKNIDNLAALLAENDVNYIDLFSVFEATDEVLYLKRDSHWNNKGAVLAYNTILGSMDISHDLLETVRVLRTDTEIGDLNTMIYPLTSVAEWNYSYEYEQTYSYVTDTDSVEDSWIITENAEGDGTLLMFRDSFGNTLLPLMANTFSDSYFAKGVPYLLGSYMNTYNPDTVIIEKVERNINEFAENPPVFLPEATTLEQDATEAIDATTCAVGMSENDMSYVCISGILDEANVAADTEVYIKLSAGEEELCFPAFYVSSDETDYGYMLYIAKDDLAVFLPEGESQLEVAVITITGETAALVQTIQADVSEYLE